MKIKINAVPQASFTLKRVGQFTVRVSGPNHCGTSETMTIAYKLECRCSADSLDDRGFLFDQTRIDAWFQSQTETSLSCEQYAVFCGRELWRLIHAENTSIDVRWFAVTLSPAPYGAELTFAHGIA